MQNVADLNQEMEYSNRKFYSSTSSLNNLETESPNVTLKNFKSNDPFSPLQKCEREVTDTSHLSSSGQATVVNLEQGRKNEEIMPATENASSVDGCVLCLQENDTVRCLLKIGGVERESLLPRALFEESNIELFQGNPFSAKVVSENGFKSLKLIYREPSINSDTKKQIFDLLEQLD
jgi:hypothetical protein